MTRRPLRTAALLAAVPFLLAGCLDAEPPITTGESAAAAEIARVRANRDFRIDEAGSARVRLVASGREIVLEPADGLCLKADAVELSETGVFAAVGECLEAPVDTGARFPGLITLSVGAGPMFDPGEGERAALRRMRDFLGTAPGLTLLGRGVPARPVSLVDSRRLDRALYVHVHEENGEGFSLFAPDFWRAFVEIRGRLVLVTASALEGAGIDEKRLLGVLAAQVARLRRANAEAPSSEEDLLASAALATLAEGGAVGAARRVPPASDTALEPGAGLPGVPVPPARVARGGAAGSEPGPLAPDSAPRPRRRL